jgi:hypothetical protein
VKNIVSRIAREALGAAFWVYALTKLFVFDIDVYAITQISPHLAWLVQYKAVVLMSLLALLWVSLGNRRSLVLVGFVAIYPFIIVFRLFKPFLRIAMRRWALLLLFSPVIIAAAKNARVTFLMYTVAFVSALLIAMQSRAGFVMAAMAGVLLFLLAHLWRSFRKAYSLPLFDQLTDLVRSVRNAIEAGKLDHAAQASTGPSVNTQAGQPRSPTSLYLYHSIADAIAGRIHNLVKRRIVDLYLIASWLYTAIVMVTGFAFLYWGLWKIQPRAFDGANDAGFWDFFAYSFERVAPGGLSHIVPMLPNAMILSYVEGGFGILIVVILVFTFLTAAREAYREGAEEFTSELRLTADAAEQRAYTRYKLTLVQIEGTILVTNRIWVNALRKARGMPELPAPQTPSANITTSEGMS